MAPAPAATAPQGDTSSGTVLETMNAGGYTYLQVDTGKIQQWVAVPVIIDDIFITHNISTSIDSNQSINKFSIQIDSLYYYSKKFGTFRYMKSLILLYKATSLFTNKHNAKLKLLLSKKI